MDLEEVWRIREEEIYPKLFGVTGKGIYTLSQALFAERFKQTDVDPRWLFLGIFEFAPTGSRPFRIYATSGRSNPWEAVFDGTEADGPSGSGTEFLLAASSPGEWAIVTLLSLLAFDLLPDAGRYPGKAALNSGDRIPLRASINGNDDCCIRNLIVTHADDLWPGFILPSGRREKLSSASNFQHILQTL
nr:suppressor of fused domain protein [uncultured Rhodopila sp.]